MAHQALLGGGELDLFRPASWKLLKPDTTTSTAERGSMKNITQIRARQAGKPSGTYHEVMHALSGGGAIVEFFPSDEVLAPEALSADLMRRSDVADVIRALQITDEMVGVWCTLDVNAEGIAERLVEMAKPLIENQLPLGEFAIVSLAAALRSEGLPRVLSVMVETESCRSASAHGAGLAFRARRDGKMVGLGAPLGYTAAEVGNRLNQADAGAAWLDALEATLSAPTFPYHVSHLLEQMLSAAIAAEAAK